MTEDEDLVVFVSSSQCFFLDNVDGKHWLQNQTLNCLMLSAKN